MSTPFKCAKRDDIQKLTKLVQDGADVNSTTFNDETALHIAVKYDRLEMIEILKSLINANPNSQQLITQTLENQSCIERIMIRLNS